MKIYVVSLIDSPRREWISKQFERLNLNFTFFDAVNGKALSDNEISKYCDEIALISNPRWLNRGAIGCAISHYFIYQEIVKDQIQEAIIIEDDMCLNKNFKSLIEIIKNRNTISPEVLMFYYRSHKPIMFSGLNTQTIFKKYKILSPLDMNSIPGTTGAYFINYNAALILSNNLLPIRVCADSWGYFMKEFNFPVPKVIYPRPIVDAGFESEIEYVEKYGSSFTRWIKGINNPLFDFLKKLNRKRMEKSMSNFKVVKQPSIFID